MSLEWDRWDLYYSGAPPADAETRFAEWYRAQPLGMKAVARAHFPRLVEAIERGLLEPGADRP